MAVELCKVSLWINASVRDQPLSFLDHHIKCGNSLIGATPELMAEGIPAEAFALGIAFCVGTAFLLVYNGANLGAAAGLFHAAGEDWTISSAVYDVTNYGFYAGDDWACRSSPMTRSITQ